MGGKRIFCLLLFIVILGSAGQPDAQQPDTEPPISVLSLIHRSKEKVSENRLDEALEQIRAAIALDPAYAGVWKQQGRVLMLKKDYSGAVASLKMSLELKAEDEETHGWILRSLIAEDKLGEIAAYLDALPEKTLFSIDADIISEVLIKIIETADVVNGERIASRWESKSPNPGSRVAASAIIQLIRGNTENARKKLESYVRTAMGSERPLSVAWNLLGRRLLDSGDTEKAIEAQNRSLDYETDFLPALRELGWAYRRSGKPSLAVKAWQRGIKKNPGLISWYRWIAEAQFEAGQLKEAEATAERLLMTDPGSSQGRTLKLASLLLQKKDDEALFSEGRLGKASGGARIISIAHVLADKYSGRFKDAIRRLEDLRSGPEDAEIRTLLADTYARWAATLKGREAVEPLQKLVALTPEDAGAWRDLGWRLWADGQRDRAILSWERALSMQIPRRQYLIVQIVSRLAEDENSSKAVGFYERWNKNPSFLNLGIELVESNHYIAAREMLAEAWRRNEDSVFTGFYYAYAKSRTGVCSSIPEHLDGFLKTRLSKSIPSEIERLLEILERCYTVSETLALLVSEKRILDLPGEYASRVNGILEKAATELAYLKQPEKAMDIYKIILARDPDRPGIWYQAAILAESLSGRQEMVLLLREIRARAASKAVQEGIDGMLAELGGDLDSAISYYHRSLSADSEQAWLRRRLFNALMSNGSFDAARKERDWFSERLFSSGNIIKEMLAEMTSAMGETEQALDLWQQLNSTYSETPYYAIETAKAMFQLCRADEAVSILEKLLALNPNHNAYALLAEIELEMQRYEKALAWAEAGTAIKPTTEMLRIKAEAAEALGKYDVALETADRVLKTEPHNITMNRIAGQIRYERGQQDEARIFYEKLLSWNPAHLSSLVHLDWIAARQNNTGLALKYAAAILKQRPWDGAAYNRHAIALAEDEKYRSSLNLLRARTTLDVTSAVPVLIYNEITSCQYPGRNRVEQFISHIERLHAEGYSFITPEGLYSNKGPAVLVVVKNPEPQTLQELDSVLKKVGGRAVLAIQPPALKSRVPGNASPEELSALATSGRWLMASSGPSAEKPANPSNPLTEGAYIGAPRTKTLTSDPATLIRNSVIGLENTSPRIFLYPKGDYGQISTGNPPEFVEKMIEETGRAFQFGIISDESGFVMPDYNPLLLLGKIVEPDWSNDRLIQHLLRKNPVVNANLELAKVLAWQKQHEQAHLQFGKAESMGADPAEVNYHWAGNAYFEGDLALAIQKIREANQLDPSSEKTILSKARYEGRKDPQFAAFVDRWKDSDERSYSDSGIGAHVYVSDRVQMELFAEKLKWSREGLGEEKGNKYGAGVLWHMAPQYWLTARGWYMDLNNSGDHAAGTINLHIPNVRLGGFIEAEAGRIDIDTVEAVRSGILSNYISLNTYSRIKDEWDLYVNLNYANNTDANNVYGLEGRFVKRFHEWPLLAAGYLFRFGDSSKQSPAYWSPEQLQEHELYGSATGEYKILHYALTGQAGAAEAKGTNWRFVWSFRSSLDINLSSKLQLNGKYVRQETPTYRMDEWLFGLSYRF